MKQLKSILTAGVMASIVVQSMAQSPNQVFFDFGRHDGNVNGAPVANPVTPSGGSGSYYWNSIGAALQGQNVGDMYNSFVASDNSALTGWAISVGANVQANGILSGGLLSPSATLLGDLAVPNATKDYFFTTTSASLLLSGLNPSYTYGFKFFGTRETTISRTTTYSATGLIGTSTTSPLQTSGTAIGAGAYNGNNNTTVALTGIAPDALGNITIGFNAASGGFGYLGAMRVDIVSVPEPTSLALLGLAGIGLVISRRRVC